MSAAARLDAADGVMDGRHFGRPIVQAGAPQFGGQFLQGGIPQFGGQFLGGQSIIQQPQFGGQFIGQPQFGGQILGGQSIIGTQFGASSAAASLDAADGVIDGRHFGRPIIQAGAPQFGGQFIGGQSIIQSGVPQFGGQIFGGQSIIGQPQFGQTIGAFPQTIGAFPQTVGFGAGSNAAALDAADGVIDGRHFGRPIIQAGAPQFGGQFIGQPQFGGQILGGQSIIQQPQFIGQPQFGGQVFGGQSIIGQPQFAQAGGFFPGQATTLQGGAGAAARLDAADGVIDGRFFGRPIVRGA